MEDNFECLWIEINTRFCKPMAVGVVCRPGYLNIEDFVKALTRILDNTDLDKVETIILGDFYVDYSAKEKSLTLQVGRICTFSFNLTQIISRPTRVTEHLNQNFTSIGRYLAEVFRNTSFAASKDVTSAYDFKLNPISETFVQKGLSKMRANKAIGLDKIGARLLRDAAWVIAPPLTYIINLSLKIGKFPSH